MASRFIEFTSVKVKPQLFLGKVYRARGFTFLKNWSSHQTFSYHKLSFSNFVIKSVRIKGIGEHQWFENQTLSLRRNKLIIVMLKNGITEPKISCSCSQDCLPESIWLLIKRPVGIMVASERIKRSQLEPPTAQLHCGVASEPADIRPHHLESP